ncbi:MAG: hypothetical protein F4Y03_05465 [Alphaproteobacteria bacterium]|nr:hypothetical protein [Alphaproteobacteria bacterium]
MPAFPFPDFPVNQQYADWLRGQGFCIEFGENEWGGYMFVSRPNHPLRIYEPAIQPDDPLAPTTIERIDLRLGVVSPWNPLSKTQQEAADE